MADNEGIIIRMAKRIGGLEETNLILLALSIELRTVEGRRVEYRVAEPLALKTNRNYGSNRYNSSFNQLTQFRLFIVPCTHTLCDNSFR